MMPAEFVIRSYRADDDDACRHLYREGTLGGRIAENDTGLDIDDIDMAYMSVEGNDFFVGCTQGGEIAGMIGVMQSDGTGEIRRLRVSEKFRRRGLGSMLLERALEFCRERNYLKIALDTYIDRDPAVKLFEKFHFRHGKSRTYSGKELMVFYLDLYSGEAKDGQG